MGITDELRGYAKGYEILVNYRLLEIADRIDANVKRLEAENTKLRELCDMFVEYVEHDRCEGCICKTRCNEGDIYECWQLTEIHEAANELDVYIKG